MMLFTYSYSPPFPSHSSSLVTPTISLMYVTLEHDYIGLSEASSTSKASIKSCQSDNKNVLNLKATELRLGLPGLCQDLENNSCKNSPIKNNVAGAKRGFYDTKAQVVGWPPIRSFRKNTMAPNLSKNGDVAEGNTTCKGCLYVKVSMDGAPYLRKVDLKTCKNYNQLSTALEKMFNCFTLGQCSSIRGKEGLMESNLKDILHRDESCVLTYEDKDGDWMLVGDVPWEMFVDSCKRLRIMKGSEAIGLAMLTANIC